MVALCFVLQQHSTLNCSIWKKTMTSSSSPKTTTTTHIWLLAVFDFIVIRSFIFFCKASSHSLNHLLLAWYSCWLRKLRQIIHCRFKSTAAIQDRFNGIKDCLEILVQFSEWQKWWQETVLKALKFLTSSSMLPCKFVIISSRATTSSLASILRF